ncbi:integrase [Arthrobacter globiformis]|uniref:site-specific integrase n=1 Tax=Arthrobacter globiformis TaxID=1665 RepID=UPI002785BAA7|nr:tyrosine-type recombinase/integrase [Arthrobacter globiformis]MDQ1059751.1 integrase [Arthrobacter globiformis]
MNGSVYKRCSCPTADLPLDQRTGKRRPCSKQHGSWWFHTRGPVDAATGKPKRISRGGYRNKRDAEVALAEVTAQIRSGIWTDDHRVTVSAWLDAWLVRKQANGLRPATVRVYRQHIDDYLKPFLGSILLRDLRPGHVADMLARLQTNPGTGGHSLSPNTLTRVHACLRSALSTAVKMRLVAFNAARDVELPKVTRKRVKPWQPAELGAFLDAVQNDRLGALFETVAASGMRRGEACGLRWDDLDPGAGVITVRQQLTERSGDDSVCPFCGRNHQGLAFATPKTDSGEYRKIELDQVTAGVLLHHQVQQGLEKMAWGDAYSDHGLVFCREDGNPLSPSHVTGLFHKLTDAVQLPDGFKLRRVRLHDLRHGQASLMLAAGVDMNIISKRLGHARSSFTADTYAHMLDGVGRDAAEKAASLIPRRIVAGNN